MSEISKGGEYIIERLNSENLTDMGKLHAAVYGAVLAENFFPEKYDTAFTGITNVGFIAYDKQHIPVAFYGVIPCFIRFGNRIIPSAQSADTMTHPEHRNKGLFVELAELTIQLCRNSSIGLLFGFPNQNSLPGFINKLEWKRSKNMTCFIIPAASFSWGRAFRKIPALKTLHDKYRRGILKKYLLPQQGIDSSVLNEGQAGIYRDRHFLKYKTYTHNQVIKIGNSILWIKVGPVLLIGDMLTSEDEFGETMDKLKRIASRMGIKEIHFHASPGTKLHTLFSLSFNSIPSFPVIFKDLEGGIEMDKIKFTSADIDTY